MNAPDAVSKHQAFVNDVNVALQRKGLTELTILFGDLNAHIGTDNETWKDVIGRHGHSWEKFGHWLDSKYFSKNKVCILADHSPLAWVKIKCHSLHQGFKWEHSQG